MPNHRVFKEDFERVSAAFEPSMKSALERVAWSRGRSMSAELRDAAQRHIDDFEIEREAIIHDRKQRAAGVIG